jgi:hypothetical protein
VIRGHGAGRQAQTCCLVVVFFVNLLYNGLELILKKEATH